MSGSKKYYYLKLKENFFDTDELRILQSMPDGYLFSDILMKLYLKSLQSEGRLTYKGLIPYTPDILATLTNHQTETVQKALKIFESLGLVEVLDNGVIYMLDIQSLIGRSSTEADRQRDYYSRIKAEKSLAQDNTQNCTENLSKEPCKKSCKKSDKISTPEIRDRDKSIDIEPPLPPYSGGGESTQSESLTVETARGTDIEKSADHSKTLCEKRFAEFWEAYPKKVGKGAAEKAFKKIKPGAELFVRILEAVSRQRNSDQWRRDNGRFVPNPATWLNQHRWEDELDYGAGMDPAYYADSEGSL